MIDTLNVFAEEKFGRDTRVIPVDFSAAGTEIYKPLAKQLSSLDIGVLGEYNIRDKITLKFRTYRDCLPVWRGVS